MLSEGPRPGFRGLLWKDLGEIPQLLGYVTTGVVFISSLSVMLGANTKQTKRTLF